MFKRPPSGWLGGGNVWEIGPKTRRGPPPGHPGPSGAVRKESPVIQFLTDLLSSGSFESVLEILRVFSWED